MKRRLDDTIPTAKRVHLDVLFDGLLLRDEVPKKTPTKCVINPGIKLTKYSVGKPSRDTSTPVDSFIADKLREHFHHVMQAGSSVIRWYLPYVLIVYLFQQWTLRLFNRFLRRYCHRHGVKFRAFKFYDKVLGLVANPQVQFTYEDLKSILSQENELEMLRLRFDRTQHEEEQLLDIKYNYWDRLEVDLDMEEAEEPPTPRIEFLEDVNVDAVDMDVDVGVDVGEKAMELDYGLYYQGYSQGV